MADLTWWQSLLVGIASGGGLSALTGGILHRHREHVEVEQIETETESQVTAQLQQLVASQVEYLVKPLQDRLEDDQLQIKHLEEQQRKLFASTAYIRSLGHWMNELCEILDPQWAATHPKPHLPDSIRSEIGGLS